MNAFDEKACKKVSEIKKDQKKNLITFMVIGFEKNPISYRFVNWSPLFYKQNGIFVGYLLYTN